jgi:hypothetical protein
MAMADKTLGLKAVTLNQRSVRHAGIKKYEI